MRGINKNSYCKNAWDLILCILVMNGLMKFPPVYSNVIYDFLYTSFGSKSGLECSTHWSFSHFT
jgi:hypothetical protein